jgi:hypothetical protein
MHVVHIQDFGSNQPSASEALTLDFKKCFLTPVYHILHVFCSTASLPSIMESLEMKFLADVEKYLVIISNAHRVMQLYQTTGIGGVTLNKAVC